ncbi:crossover junction endonuclease MUS81 isoform X2 [Kryptolebias marmoratus]|uniref:crossover junction endonuclease MUS81 isoform X2 n=1 Tax=Kryptolebias marmoratus TaxID=37003 RepID=UPI0007F8ECE6|nr:crossover junction endonuclease MUS81 isoform X2 [Kryptolebias marmoratus]
MPAPESVRWGRKRVLPVCPNPLFLKWLTELRDDAKEKGLKIQFTYQKAINSLNKYPLPLRSAKEAKILQNFGDGICKILDDRLQRHSRENGPDALDRRLDADSLAPPPGTTSSSVQKDGGGGGGTRKRREYVPQRRSGGYAVLLALLRQSQVPGHKGFMFKMELQAEAQSLCDGSCSAPDLGRKHSIWSSVRTLIQKNLVVKTHNPARFSLTEEGRVLAERLAAAAEEEEEEEEEEVVDLTGSADEEEEPQVLTADDDDEGPPVSQTASGMSGERLLPGSFDVVLCVDFIETTGGARHRKQELVRELQRNGVAFDVRKLNVGDFLWVAREKIPPVPGALRVPAGRELVLDFIVERKRMDDLCGSIIDGRFREQKFRLKRCGLQRLIYLVEGGGASASHLSLPEATLQQAVVNTQVVDGFFVKRVQDVRESAAYLTIMTRYLSKLYQNRTLTRRSRELEGDAGADATGSPSCSLISFEEFNHGAVKNKCQTVREVFARQLMQISSLSGDKAAAILERYSTPHSLLAAYDRCSSEAEKEKLLAGIRCGKLQRNLGPALSRTVYQLYCSDGALS